MRNRTEYEGVLDVDDRLVADLIGACRKVADRVTLLPPILEKCIRDSAEIKTIVIRDRPRTLTDVSSRAVEASARNRSAFLE